MSKETIIHTFTLLCFTFFQNNTVRTLCTILVYLNNAIMYERLSNLESDDIESIWLKVKLMHSNFFFYDVFIGHPTLRRW